MEKRLAGLVVARAIETFEFVIANGAVGLYDHPPSTQRAHLSSALGDKLSVSLCLLESIHIFIDLTGTLLVLGSPDVSYPPLSAALAMSPLLSGPPKLATPPSIAHSLLSNPDIYWYCTLQQENCKKANAVIALDGAPDPSFYQTRGKGLGGSPGIDASTKRSICSLRRGFYVRCVVTIQQTEGVIVSLDTVKRMVKSPHILELTALGVVSPLKQPISQPWLTYLLLEPLRPHHLLRGKLTATRVCHQRQPVSRDRPAKLYISTLNAAALYKCTARRKSKSMLHFAVHGSGAAHTQVFAVNIIKKYGLRYCVYGRTPWA
ncbi:hypothetical protein V8D89_002396 [Ganoderma adspersum]